MSEMWRNYGGNVVMILRTSQKTGKSTPSRYRLISGEFSLFREISHSAVKYIIMPM